MSLQTEFNGIVDGTPDNVLKAANKLWIRFLFQAGGYGRKVTQRLLRPARRKRVSELNDEQRAAYRAEQTAFREGRSDTKPRLPQITSEPGNPPLLHAKPSPLKRGLRFFVDRLLGLVFVGVERSNDGIAGDLEHGRGDIKAPRPFIRVGFKRTLPRLPQILRSAANR